MKLYHEYARRLIWYHETVVDKLAKSLAGALVIVWDINGTHFYITEVMDALHKAAYRDTLGNTLYMSPHRVGQFTPDLLKEFVGQHFVTANMAVVGLGVDHDHLIHLLQHKLGLPKSSQGQAAQPAKSVYYGGQYGYSL